MQLYTLLKDTHSILRWFVILAGLWALVRVWLGLLNSEPWTKKDRIAGLVFTTFLNLQLVLGLALYFTSPITTAAMKNMKAIMHESSIRFFAVDHPTGMFLAIIIAQVGFSISKRSTKGSRHQFLVATITYTVAFLLVLGSIPWPFFEKYGRPLFPHFGP